MKNSNIKKLIFSILKLLVVIVAVFGFMKFMQVQNKPVIVVGYKTNMEEGVKVTKDDIKQVEVSPKAFTPNMIKASEAGKFVGKYTTTKVFADTIAYKKQLDDMGMSEGFSSIDFTTAREISLPISMVDVFAGDIKRGDTVDLLFSGRGSVSDKVSEETSTFSYAKTFLWDVPVFQVNTGSGYKFVSRAHVVPGEKYMEEEGTGSEEAIASITLMVTPEQAEEIRAREQVGKITFVKRFPESETHETLGFVIGNYGKIFTGNANAETNSMNVVNNFKEEAGLNEETEKDDDKDKNKGPKDIEEIK